MLFSKRTKLLKVLFLFLGFLVVAAPAKTPAAELPSSVGADSACAKLVYRLSVDSGPKYYSYTRRIVSSSPVKKYYYFYPDTKIIRIYYNGHYPVVIREPQPQPKPQPQPQPQPQPKPQSQPQPQPASVKGLTADEQRMVELVNQERAAAGLPALKVNLELVKVARLKAQDMVANNYFSHTSPTYGSPFAMMKQFGITYRTAGENLAGAPDVEMAHKNLMTSPGHRANILNASFTQVGIGVAEGSPYGKIFVQMFIG